MWDGITPVEPGYDPIVSESAFPLGVLVTNAGPSTITLKAWDRTQPGDHEAPDISMELRPGSTRFVVASLVRLHSTDAEPEAALGGNYRQPSPRFAAAGWRIGPQNWRPWP
jgi:hypothetical protein